MSWVGIANNQTVSFNNLQDAVTNGYFVALTSIPASQEQITKTDASTYVNIDTSYAPYAAKASNQLVVKSNLRPISYAYTIYYEEACYYDGFYIEGGAASAALACANTLTITLYSPVSSFANGMKLFYDAACSNPWYGDTGACGQYYKVIIAGNAYTFTYPNSGSTVQNLTICDTSTTTTTTTTTITTLFTNLFFDATTSACGYYIDAIDVNGVTPTLTGGTDVPFCTDGHSYNTSQTGSNETLNLTVGSLVLNGCITVTDSASNTYSQNIPFNGVYSFTGLVIDNTTTVQIIIADNFC